MGNREIIDVSDWRGDEEYPVYPVGAREKSLIISPEHTKKIGLIPNHRYLFKHTLERAPEQYWSEIIAYRLGSKVGVDVPPAYVAFDSDTGQSGALIEWFLDKQIKADKNFFSSPFYTELNLLRRIYLRLFSFMINTVVKNEFYANRFMSGGVFLQGIVKGFDNDKGKKHNLTSVVVLCKMLKQTGALDDDWLYYWAKVFAFDSLIGNTDRHQENWGFILYFERLNKYSMKLSPVFDNGTSLGYELGRDKYPDFTDNDFEKYIKKGKHHMRWAIGENRLSHLDFIKKFADKYPDTIGYISDVINISDSDIAEAIYPLCEYDVPIELTKERAEFIDTLLRRRRDAIRKELGL